MSSALLLCLLLRLSSAVLSGIATQKMYLPYKSNLLTCLNTTTEYFNSKIHMCCSRCPPGKKALETCTEMSDTVCENCGPHQYTEHWNTLRKCMACEAHCDKDQEMVQDCTPSTKQICQCREGLHCIDSTKDTCNRCRKNTECQEGRGVIEQGTKQKDVKCAPCAAGSFSNEVSSTEPCHPHTDCRMLGRKTSQNGTSTRDAICSNELLPQILTTRVTSSATGPSSPALTQVTHPTEIEPESAITFNTNMSPVNMSPNRKHSTESFLPSYWTAVICVTLISVIVMVIVVLVCHKKRGRMTDLWDQNANVPKDKVDPVDTDCLIVVPESELEVVSPRNGMCEQNDGVTGSVPRTDRLCSLSRSSSSGSGGVRRKPGTGYSSKEEEQTQTHLAIAHLNNYSRIDSLEDQGYISRESRPSSGAPSPVMEFSGNPTVSVTINTGKCYVNCCHRQGGGTSGAVSAEEDFPAPEEEEGTEVDEGFPIQEEQKVSESEKWKEAGLPVEAESECHWRQCNSVKQQEDGKELQLPVQDTSGNIY
ncbi:tumor necrosis factor receptor superfamily member 1B-like isoform X2 [Carcharodon carcharias]|uniref:tumor necrosis factor receptor superfamily member 1B-like isoform X2 n=1 Tax=Carcharodon carcharias TaxID=13397 RepID=UPI001B7ECA53|nr:tumor necrosis factor receptor superfamily member 1B-like isoform X2 [Carcharodon carcharias]